MHRDLELELVYAADTMLARFPITTSAAAIKPRRKFVGPASPGLVFLRLEREMFYAFRRA